MTEVPAARGDTAIHRTTPFSRAAILSALLWQPPGDIPDTSKLYAAAKKLSMFLISRAAIVPVVAAALLPLVAAGASQLPIRELLRIAREVAAGLINSAEYPLRLLTQNLVRHRTLPRG